MHQVTAVIGSLVTEAKKRILTEANNNILVQTNNNIPNIARPPNLALLLPIGSACSKPCRQKPRLKERLFIVCQRLCNDGHWTMPLVAFDCCYPVGSSSCGRLEKPARDQYCFAH